MGHGGLWGIRGVRIVMVTSLNSQLLTQQTWLKRGAKFVVTPGRSEEKQATIVFARVDFPKYGALSFAARPADG